MNELIIAKFVIIKPASSYGGLADSASSGDHLGGPFSFGDVEKQVARYQCWTGPQELKDLPLAHT